MIHVNTFAKRLWMILLASAFAITASAQFLRTSYLQDVPYSLQLNPAQVPSHGYINPILGPLNVTMQTNVFGVKDVTDMFSKDGDYFMSQEFIDKLESENKVNLNLSWDQVSFGWFDDLNFFSFNIGTRVDAGSILPKSLFEFMRTMNGDINADFWKQAQRQNMSGGKAAMLGYQEIGFGYARKISDKLTVGAKFKVLLGASHLDLEIKELSAETPGIDMDKIQAIAAGYNLDWSKLNSQSDIQNLDPAIRNEIKGQAEIKVNATAKATMGGLEWEYATDKYGQESYINDVKMNGFKFSGWGLGLDLGATYEVMDNLEVTGAITDLGFINWGKSNSKIVSSNVHKTYDLSNDEDLIEFANMVSSKDILNYDMLQMKESDGDGYTTSLYTNLTLGGQYTLNDKLVFGALYTGHFSKPRTVSELTLSAAYNLSTWANFALSYSMIQSGGKSMGLGLRLGALYIGTDYMYFGNSSSCLNALIGLSIPLNKGKSFNSVD